MWSLTHTQPNRSAFETRIARPTSRVHTDDASPYGVPLAHAIASASSENGCTVITRAEDLALDHLVVLLEAGDDRRLEEEARQVRLDLPPVAISAWSGLALQEALDPLALARGVERAERRVVGARVAQHEPLGLLGEPVDDVVVDLRARPARGSRRCSPGRRCSSRCRRSSPSRCPCRRRRRRPPAPCRRARGGRA